MSNTLQTELSVALATRLNLQISLSSLAVVEEWMDPKLDRWLESIPMPPELPEGTSAAFVVTLASDRSRLRWAAAGPPPGFVPKLADYLSKCGVLPSEVDLINTIGETFDPAAVGSWVEAQAGSLMTGWQFVDRLPLADIAAVLADCPANAKLVEWGASAGVDRCVRVARCIAEKKPFSEITVEVSVDQAREAAAAVSGAELPEPVVSTLGSGSALQLTVRAPRSGAAGVVVSAAGIDETAARELEDALGLSHDDKLRSIQNALGATGVSRVRYSAPGGAHALDFDYEPGAADAKSN